MLENDKANLLECLFVIDKIQNYTLDFVTLEELMADMKTWDAVLMNFIVLGNSAAKLSNELKNKLQHVDWRAINGFRNFIAHDYFGLDENIIWSTIQFRLPELKEEFQKLLPG